MKLAFRYDGSLQSRLRQHAPQTDHVIQQYHASQEDYHIFHDHDEFQRLIRIICDLPEIPDVNLRSPREIKRNLVSLLGLQGSDPRRDCIQRTLDSHERKGDGLEDEPLYGELSLVIARCIPYFLLESHTNFPRLALFAVRDGRIHHFLPLPKKNLYPMLLS
ncbi:hypothetical protein J4421_04100 [Candidatus Woesearchaeota archaeon]|nr:hypothetical protein [Candidatus Woesearchaeota archaeon]